MTHGVVRERGRTCWVGFGSSDLGWRGDFGPAVSASCWEHRPRAFRIANVSSHHLFLFAHLVASQFPFYRWKSEALRVSNN